MIFYKEERLAIFIDGANLYSASRALGFDIDYRKLSDFFAKKSRLIRAYYYTILFEEQDYSPLRPLVDWLDYNGYTMVTKPLRDYTDAQGRRRIKGSIDIDLAVDALEISNQVDHVVLFAGDNDFRRLIEALQRRGVRVSVAGTVKAQPSSIADEIRRAADSFIELADLAPHIERAPARASRLPLHVDSHDDEDTDEAPEPQAAE